MCSGLGSVPGDVSKSRQRGGPKRPTWPSSSARVFMLWFRTHPVEVLHVLLEEVRGRDVRAAAKPPRPRRISVTCTGPQRSGALFGMTPPLLD